MPNPGHQSDERNSETIAGELAAIVGWLQKLPAEEIGKLREALVNHDAANLSVYVAHFQDLEGHSHGAG
jgi:hypothetical protein